MTAPKKKKGKEAAPADVKKASLALIKEGKVVRPDALMNGLVDAHFKSTGSWTIESADAERVMIGVPLEALSQRLVFQSTVLPLGRVIHAYGPTESMKTALSCDIMRLHNRMRMGISHFNLAEPRDSPQLRNSILDHDELIAKCRLLPCASMDEWQINNTNLVKMLNKHSGDKPGNCPFAICSVVDSIAGAATGKTIKKVMEEGYADPGFSEEAKSFNIYAKVIFSKMARWPITWIGTNHLKLGTDKHGNDKGRTPGGQATGFYTTFGLEMQRVSDYKRLDDAGRLVLIKVAKNSLGDARLWMYVNMLWWKDEHKRQHTYWDWYDASIRYLRSLPGIQAKDGWHKKIEEVVDLEYSEKGDRVTSKALGVKKATFREAGMAIEGTPAVRDGLDQVFGISAGRPFVPGVPYEMQRKLAIDNVPLEDVVEIGREAQGLKPGEDVFFEPIRASGEVQDVEALLASPVDNAFEEGD